MPARSARRSGPTESSDRQIVVFDAKERAEKLQAAVDDRRPQLLALLGGDARLTERFITVALDAIVRDKNLLRADELSLLSSIRTAALMGLEPSGVLGDGAIVVYDNIAQFQPMYRGLMKLARNGDVMAIDAARHYENDEFDYQRGTDPHILHRPVIGGDRGSVVGAYAYAKLSSGELVVRYMTVAEIHAIRDRFSRQWQRSGSNSIWGQNPEPMELKTVVHRVMTYLPLTPKAQEVLAYDQAADSIRVETLAQRQLAEQAAPGSRTRARFAGDAAEAPENGSGATEEGEAEAVEGEVVEDASPGVCGAHPPEGGVLEQTATCVLPFGHDAEGETSVEHVAHHENEAGDTWPL